MGIGRGGPPKLPGGLGPPDGGPAMPAAGGGGPAMPACKYTMYKEHLIETCPCMCNRRSP